MTDSFQAVVSCSFFAWNHRFESGKGFYVKWTLALFNGQVPV